MASEDVRMKRSDLVPLACEDVRMMRSGLSTLGLRSVPMKRSDLVPLACKDVHMKRSGLSTLGLRRCMNEPKWTEYPWFAKMWCLIVSIPDLCPLSYFVPLAC